MARNHSAKNTVHMTLRVPQRVANALENEAYRLNTSTRSLHNSILLKWADWDSGAQNLGMVPIPKEILADLISCMGEKEIHKMVSKSMKFFKNAVIMMEGGYDLKRCIVTLEKYMRATGMASNHTSENGVHRFTVMHGMGTSWSLFIEFVLRQIFAEFVPDQKITFKVSDGITVCKIALGSDWNEHDY